MVVRQQQADEVANDKQLTHPRGLMSQHKQLLDSIKADGKGDVKAYFLVALRGDNDISSMTSRSLEGTVGPVIHEWAGAHMRIAHEHARFIEQEGDEDGQDEDQKITVGDPVTTQHGNHEISTQRLPRKLLYASGTRQRIRVVDHAFMIEDEDSVVQTLWTCLNFLQQNIVKRLSKALIKGICPQKQAKFPYRNKKGEIEGREVEIPPWWPSVELCRFVEPDHVDRWERIELCLHFLRLRPTPEQLKEWNSCEKSKQPVRTHQPHRWVSFLEELAPLSIVDEVDPKDAEKGGRRKNLMRKMFEVATLEEEYKDGGTDGNTIVQPLEGELQKTIDRSAGVKRSRHSSLAADITDDENSDSDESVPHKALKKARTTQSKAEVVPVKQKAKVVAAGKPKRKTKRDTRAASDAARRDGQSDSSDRKPYFRGYEPLYHPPWDARMPTGFVYREHPPATPYNTSFGSNKSDFSSCDGAAMIPSSPGASTMMQNHGGIAYQTNMQVNNAYDISQPQFDTMPNTPTFASNEMLPFEQQPSLGHEMAGLSIGMPPAPHHLASRGQPSPAFEHHMHGLPTQTTIKQYRHWPETQPSPFAYQLQPGVSSTQTHHCGFAVGNDALTPTTWATPYQSNRNPHGEHDLPYSNLVFGPHHEQPPATLPASVERGFTGHASGVGDSACPPGYPAYIR